MTAQEYADEFYHMIWNNHDSSHDLTKMFMEYGKDCAKEALLSVAYNARVRMANTDAQVTKEILSTQIKTP